MNGTVNRTLNWTLNWTQKRPLLGPSPEASRATIQLQIRPALSDITHMLKSLPMLSRWGRRSTLGSASGLRLECGPPSLRNAPDSSWQRLMFWLMAPAAQDASPPLNRLPAVRTEFMATLADISSADADRLRVSICEAFSLRELWHVRAELFGVIGLAHSQSEAEQRLLLLNRHFPARTPRSQFAAL